MNFSQKLILVPDFGTSLEAYMQWMEINKETIRQYCHSNRMTAHVEEILERGVWSIEAGVCSWEQLGYLKRAAQVYDLIKSQADARTLSLNASDFCVIYCIGDKTEYYTYLLEEVVFRVDRNEAYRAQGKISSEVPR